jgi:hypothetical protein
MARFTAQDEQIIMAALIAKAEGKRVKSTEVGGQRREFDGMSTVDMLALLTEIRADIAMSEGSSPRRTYAKNGGHASC